jgi:hypothetical protein
MTDNITLPRAVVEMVRDSLDYARRFNGASVSAEIAALDAALAEPNAKPEPVAFAKNGNLFWCGDASQMRGVDIDLYPAPPQPDATREPATEKQVAEVFKLSGAVYWGHYRNGWRDAERFHGITKEDGK